MDIGSVVLVLLGLIAAAMGLGVGYSGIKCIRDKEFNDWEDKAIGCMFLGLAGVMFIISFVAFYIGIYGP